MKILKSNRGSSFIYVLVVLLILTILTASLITATVTNYQLGILKGGRNTSFYLNDGAIEEALAEIEELSHRAEVVASGKVQADEAEFKKETEWIEFELWLSRKMKLDSTKADFLSQDDASDYYEKALRKEFDKQFLLYLLEVDEDDIEKEYELINKDDEFVEGNDFIIGQTDVNGLSKSVIEDLEEVTFDPKAFTSFEDVNRPTLLVTSEYLPETREIKLIIQSDGTYSIYKKQIEVAVTMIPPVYDYTTVTTLKRQKLYKNDILENALTATKDILVTGGKVSTVGDVYAKGTFPEEKRIYSHQKGGVVIGYEENADDFLDIDNSKWLSATDLEVKGSLDVKGHVKSGTSIKLYNDASSLKVSTDNPEANAQSNVFADSFIVMKNSEDTKTTVDSHMLILDDLFVNASKTTITIGKDETEQGYFMTFFDGAGLAESTVPMNPDLSSSIRVNKNAVDISIIVNRLFIPGVAYIDIFRNTITGRKYFQTGESMTAETNFYFYQNQLSDQAHRTKEITFLDDSGNEHTAYEYVDDDGNIIDSVKYKVDHFFTTVRDADLAGDVDIVSPNDKSIIDIRDLSNPEVYKDIYTLGVFLANGKVYNPSRLKMLSPAFDSKYRLEFGKSIDLAMNLLGMRNYKDGKNIVIVDEKDDESQSFMDTFVDYTKDITFDNINRNNRLIVLNRDEKKDIYINYPSGFTPSDTSIKVNNVYELTSVIATKGNIFIYNENASEPLNISGTLISDQSIIFYGPGEKVITRSDETVYGTISQYDDLVEAFHVNEGRHLATLFLNGTTKPDEPVDPKFPDEGLTRSIHFNLDLTVDDGGEPVNVNILTNPQLDGSSKEESVKGYVVDYWKEF